MPTPSGSWPNPKAIVPYVTPAEEPCTVAYMMTLTQLQTKFATQNECLAYLVSMRWPTGAVDCPRCGNTKVYKLSLPYKWQCKGCAKDGYRFSPLTGTIFENTNIKLPLWFQAILIICGAKKGISALQLQRLLGVGSYRTAWYMCHRIRAAMKSDTFMQLTGVVEEDETYIGGKAKNRHGGGIGSGFPRGGARGTAGKMAVIGAISRKGNVTCKVIEQTDAATLQGFVAETVSDAVKLVATDEHAGYKAMGKRHAAVNHSAGEYVRGRFTRRTLIRSGRC